MATNIVHEWLRSLDMLQYAEAFIDNGYDDLEICKQVGQPDLDAIGVEHPDHRMDILDAVSRLKEEGGTQVYFTLEPTGESSDSDRERELSGDDMLDKDEDYYTYSGGRRGKHPGRTSYPKLQLKMMVRDKLVAEGIRLNSYPFTKQRQFLVLIVALIFHLNNRLDAGDQVSELEGKTNDLFFKKGVGHHWSL
ncbi:sterile alpha motif domain-containing protein 5-like [Saccoglossus kowalevskii]